MSIHVHMPYSVFTVYAICTFFQMYPLKYSNDVTVVYFTVTSLYS